MNQHTESLIVNDLIVFIEKNKELRELEAQIFIDHYKKDMAKKENANDFLLDTRKRLLKQVTDKYSIINDNVITLNETETQIFCNFFGSRFYRSQRKTKSNDRILWIMGIIGLILAPIIRVIIKAIFSN